MSNDDALRAGEKIATGLGQAIAHVAHQPTDAPEVGVTQRGPLTGNGWVYWNPDSGEEYAPNHPVESGECVDAESVRQSTLQEDHLHAEYQRLWQERDAQASVSEADIIERCAAVAETMTWPETNNPIEFAIVRGGQTAAKNIAAAIRNLIPGKGEAK